jgi:dTDP-4-dehydrorhamnose reductase
VLAVSFGRRLTAAGSREVSPSRHIVAQQDHQQEDAMARPQVLITGASGLIGGLVRRDLSDRYSFSGLSRNPVPGLPYTRASITDLDAIRPAFAGTDAVLHLGVSVDVDNWDPQMAITAEGTLNVFRAAQEAGVPRVVFMSSGSTMCGWEWDDTLPYGRLARGEWDGLSDWPLLTAETPARPDSPYAVAKLFGEHVGRFFSDRHGMQVIVIRLGAVLAGDQPTLVRHFPGYLAQADAVQMIDRCLSAPAEIRYGIFDAISENWSRWRDTSPAKERLGWRPTGSSDRFDRTLLTE